MKNTTIQGTEVIETTEYKVFKLDIRNRPINDAKVSGFIKAFQSGKNFMKEFPAIVDENFVILDGQHRFVACQKTSQLFRFRFTDKLSIDNVIDVQTNAGWHPMDYLHAYIQQGKKDYVILMRFVKRYGIPVTTGVSLLTKHNPGSTTGRKQFYSGNFIVNDEETAHKILKLCQVFGDSGFKYYKDRSFISAIHKIIHLEQYDQKQMLDRISKYISLMIKQPNKDMYLRNLEDLYNYHSREKVRFF